MEPETPEFLFVKPGDAVVIKNEKIARILKKRIIIIGWVKLLTALEEREIQIHGHCFKLPILIMEGIIVNADIVEKILKPSEG